MIQVERGLIYQLPVVVIIRNPLDAFVSYRLRSPELNVSTMHSMYASFYGRVLELADQILLLRYEDVIGQPDAVLARIHDLLGTPEDARRPIDVSRVFDAVDKAEQNLRLAQGRPAGRSTEQDAAFATSVARPTAAKESGKQIAIDDLKNHHATAIASAHGLYEQVLERCVSFDKTSA
ncbi:MAG: sulfotransferase domain-containing protein [Pseudomonadota bacterium]